MKYLDTSKPKYMVSAAFFRKWGKNCAYFGEQQNTPFMLWSCVSRQSQGASSHSLGGCCRAGGDNHAVCAGSAGEELWQSGWRWQLWCCELRTAAGTAALAPGGLPLPLETLTPLCSPAVDPWCLCRARYMSLLLSMQYVDHFRQWWITIYFHWQRNDPYLSYEGNSLLCGNKLHYTTAYCYILISNVLISLLPSTLVNNYNKY